MIKNKHLIIIFCAVFVICSAVALFLFLHKPIRTTANIYVDGCLVKSIDLSQVNEGYSFDISSQGGKNTVLVEHGKICITDADCPDKVCVKTGWARSGMPVVCLPHKVVIELTAISEEIDSVSK